MRNLIQITRPKPSNEAEKRAEKAVIDTLEAAGWNVRIENQSGTLKYETPKAKEDAETKQ